jgi:cytidylate kinase
MSSEVKVVTIEREYGCGGGEIAKLLAQRLGWKLFDEQLTEEIARLAKCPEAVIAAREERNDPLFYRLFKSFLHGSFEGSLNAPKLNLVDSENIAKFAKRVVEHAAERGNCVIVGRGSQQFLANRVDTLRIFLYAPYGEKVRRLLARGKTRSEAEDLVNTVDQDRAHFVQKYFHAEWPRRCLYHVMINTCAGNDAVVETILSFLKIRETAATA